MDSLIPLVNKLQDVFSLVGHDPLDLPQIVVVGSQSSGKSSVLESIVMRDFLPRGKDIVTRRPLVLQLIQIRTNQEHSIEPEPSSSLRMSTALNELPALTLQDASSSSIKIAENDSVLNNNEWGEFLHLPGQKFTSFDEIRNEIEKDTVKIAGTNKGIARVPIHLKIYSPRLLTLTLVDLPGITKIPVGDQPVDIENQIKQLVYEYVSKPSSIILAVTPANVDIVNSEALKIAREVDPNGLRTIGVLTKLDLMDAGTNAFDILANRSTDLVLRLGFIGLVSRSQQDILNKKPVNEAIRHEYEYFHSHPAYRTIADRCGSAFLAKTLNALLMQHIRDQLPELRVRLNQLIALKQQELALFGEDSVCGPLNKSALLLHFLTKFSSDFCDCVNGTWRGFNQSTGSRNIYGGARINYIFNDVFANALSSPESLELALSDVRTAIRNATGTRPSLFVPEVSFDQLVKGQISKIEQPGLRCVELVLEELIRVVNNCNSRELTRFPILHARIVAVASDLIREQLVPTCSMVQNLVKIELAYINTNHPDFIRAGAAISALGKMYERKRQQHPHKGDTNGAGEEPSKKKNHPEGLLAYLFRGTQSQPASPGTPGSQRSNGGGTSPSRSWISGSRSLAPRNIDFLLGEAKLDELVSNNSSTDPPSESPGINSTPQLGSMSEKEEMEIHLIYTLTQSYCSVVRKNLQDTVPKAIMHFLVNQARESMHTKLVTELYRETLLDELLTEDPNVALERQACKQLLEVYRKAAAILNEVRMPLIAPPQ